MELQFRGVIDMKFKKVLVATAMVGVLATGVVGYGNKTDAKVYSQNGLVLHDDANFLEHELSYIDVLLDKNAEDQATKDNLRSYFADKGLHSIKDIINKAKQDGFKYQNMNT